MPLQNIFGELENFIAEDLYPLRYVITPIAIVIILAGVYLAYRLGVHLVLLRHKVATVVVVVPMLVITVIAGNYFVSPLWERSFLEEANPLAAAQTTAGGASTTTPTLEAATPGPAGTTGGSAASFDAKVVQTGQFVDADSFHTGSGDALIIETAPGAYTLRVENFSVRNGPDLYVYLSTDPTGESIEEALNLGQLKATDGAFNYEIPSGIDVSTVKSAVVWCRQFSVLFTHAQLQ